MSLTKTNDVLEHSDGSLTGSDADSESSSESTVVSVDLKNDKTPRSQQLQSYQDEIEDKSTDEPADAEKPQIGDDPKGGKLRQSELARLRKVFQNKESHDSEASSDCDKNFSRYDFSDAESVSSTELEPTHRPKLLSDYTLDYISCVPRRDFFDRDYMGTKVSTANKTLKLKERRKVSGKRREPYNVQTDSKMKKSSYLTNVKSDRSSEENKKRDTEHPNNASKNTAECVNCPQETCVLEEMNKNECLKPVASKVKLTDEDERIAAPCVVAPPDLRKYRMPTRIPVPKTRRDMEGIFKAADDQFHSLDTEISFFQEDIINFEPKNCHTLEVIEESSFETMSKDDASEETLSTGNDRGSFGNGRVDDDIQEKASNISLSRSEYTVELIEEALKEVSRQTQLEPIEEEQPFMIENRTLKNLFNIGKMNECDKTTIESEIRLIECEEQTLSEEEEKSGSEENVERAKGKQPETESTNERESASHEMLRVYVAKAALMRYAAQIKQPKNNPGIVLTEEHDDRLPSKNKSAGRSHQDATDTGAINDNTYGASVIKSTTDPVSKVTSRSKLSTNKNEINDEIVCSETNTEVISNMIKHIPLKQLSLDDECVVANISSQQYTVYIKLKNKDKEGSSEDRNPGQRQIVRLIEETPQNMLTYVTRTDQKHCHEGNNTSVQINQPKTGKEAQKAKTPENKPCRLSSTFREKVVPSRIKKTKPTASVIRSTRQRTKNDLPVLHEDNYFENITNEDVGIYEREVKRGLSKKGQEGRFNRRSSVPFQPQKNISTKSSDASSKLLVRNMPSTSHNITNLKSWLAMRQKLGFFEKNSRTTATKTPCNIKLEKNLDRLRGTQNNPFPLQTPANSKTRKRSRLVPRQYFDKAVRETRSSLLRRLKEKTVAEDSSKKKITAVKDGSSGKQKKKVDKPGTIQTNTYNQVQSEKRRVVREKPKAKIRQISPGFKRQCLSFIQPTAWQIHDSSSKFAFFCAPSYNTTKLLEYADTSIFRQKIGSVAKSIESSRASDVTRPKKVKDYVAPERVTANKESKGREKMIESRKKVKEYLDKHNDLNTQQSPVIRRRAYSKEENKVPCPETIRTASTRSVDLGRRSPSICLPAAPDLGNVWSRLSVSRSQKCVMDAESLKAPIRQQLEQESILDKESIAKDALENVFKNLNAYLNALDSSSDSSLKTCPAMHFKHTVAGDAASSEDDTQVDLYDDEEDLCGSDSNLLLSAKELRLDSVKHKIQKEPLVSDLKWSLLVAACHGYNFDKYLTPFPEFFLHNGRKDIDALMQATEEVPSLSLLYNLSLNEISPAAIELLYWLLVELSSVKVVATSTREAESCMSSRPDAVFSVWQQPSSMLDRRLRSNARGLAKVEAFCCARLDKFHALLHGGMVPSGVMLRDVDMALQLAKPGYGYGCSALGPKIKCVARCQVIVHPRLVELCDDAATVRGRNLVRVQQLMVFREHEAQQPFHMPSWRHMTKILLVVLVLHMAAFGLLWTLMWEDPLVELVVAGPDYSEAFPWLANL